MENNSITSSLHKPIASKETTSKDSTQESGWTAYFEDLSNNHFYQPKTYSPSFSCGSSLISDAATTAAAARKVSHDDRHALACPPKPAPNKLRFKETRTKEICEDDSLEDTASSPVNSPKVPIHKNNKRFPALVFDA
ncbi:hypothetical protein V6N13_102053 [Hibiscus sabdariffa]|uniref:Uncharacterized protein n=1 Tax=Hibiscus sabdariffa TaxID=183260 RepID=A0ABR2D2X2_9ROSI